MRAAHMSEQSGFVLWFTGLSGAGKTTIANIVEPELERRGLTVEHLDGDIVRTHLSKGLGFSKEDRDINIARIGWVASRIARAGAAVVVSAISPYEEMRKHARSLVEQHAPFVEIYVATSLEECARRDPKGLYAAGVRRRDRGIHRCLGAVRGAARSGDPARDRRPHAARGGGRRDRAARGAQPHSRGSRGRALSISRVRLTHLERLEAEAIDIMREVVATAENPVMLYSIGKDSSVMLRLAEKAFAPAPPPFPFLHVDTTWKFQDMYAFRARMAEEHGINLLVHVNEDGVARGINPFDSGSVVHTDVMKTEGLKQALDKYGFDAAFGGARRDEEKSRAKERIFSFRTAQHRWDPKNQRPELWRLYNARHRRGESIRVFPLSNWTELDVWLYIHREEIPIVPLYFAAERPVVDRDGTWIMVDDERMEERLAPGEEPEMKRVRFRTLGCYPLSGAIESDADTLPKIIQEMLLSHNLRAPGPHDRPRRGRLDGEEEGRGILLVSNELIERDIDAYLEAHEHKSLLRFITCGSVDDGKSTLIGRLLYESQMLFEDQMAALEADSKRVGTQGEELDFALLLDGLAAEREQGITIDVAYRFFSTDTRKYIVADTPGHEQYTRNMVTGASTADCAVILLDARKGVLTQTRRHSYLVWLLGLRHVAVAVNKMDLVDYSEERFHEIERQYGAFAERLGLEEFTLIPVSGLRGDNVLERSDAMPWYDGPTLMEYLEAVEIDQERMQDAAFRLPVQWVNRPSSDFRGYTGTVAAGQIAPGERVVVLPAGIETTVERVVAFDGDLELGVAGQAVTLTLDRRDRHQPRRHDRRRRRARAGEPAVRGDRRVDGRGAAAARPHVSHARRDERGAGHGGADSATSSRSTRSSRSPRRSSI